MENQEKKQPSQESNDVDLGALVNLFIKFCRKLVDFFTSVFRLLGSVILYILIFLRKNIIWLGLTIIVGLIWGIYVDYKKGVKYESVMTVRTNFGSSRALYNSMDYLNALVNERRLNELSKIFTINESEAASLVRFTADPVEDELVLTQLYKDKFISSSRSDLVRLDTFWSRIEKFGDFKKNLTKFDIPLHEITVISKQVDIFNKIQQGIINTVENEVLKKNQEIGLQTQKDEESIILSSIQGIDTLRKMYNLRIQKQAESKETGTTNLNFVDKEIASKTPELDLYDKVLELKDELRALRTTSMDNQEIIQVFAPFNPLGRRLNLFRQNTLGYAINLTVLVLILLAIIEVYKAVGKKSNEKKAA
ncbi:MAG TPA: hypothetical protein VMI12_15360 [Puia sp.]|nr:hypothetical protein [Puia sp.]